jgi:hypothetical protein
LTNVELRKYCYFLHLKTRSKATSTIRQSSIVIRHSMKFHTDAGIEITFRFASPSNKQMTGPLNRFIRLLYNPLYTPMLEHRTAIFGELVQEIDRARISVILTAADGQRVGYLFFHCSVTVVQGAIPPASQPAPEGIDRG